MNTTASLLERLQPERRESGVAKRGVQARAHVLEQRHVSEELTAH